MLKFEKRTEKSVPWQIGSFFLAMMGGFFVTGLLLYSADKDPIEAFDALLLGAFGGVEEFIETLVRATPLILTGLATVVAFRAKIWSIGQEGQLILGAITAYWATTLFSGLPTPLLIMVTIFFGFLGGAALGGLCGWLKSNFGVDEIISTVMLNYVMFYLLTYLLSGPWQPPGAFYLQSAPIIEGAVLPALVEDTRLHGGLFISLIAGLLVYLVLKKTPLGYDIRAFGFNPRACQFKGTNIPYMFFIVMLISGGLSGLAGSGELMGVHGRLNTDIAIGLGYTGIIVAMVGGLTPVGTILAAILFGGLVNGGFMMQILTGVPLSLVYAMQAIILLFFLSSALLARYKIVRGAQHV